MTSFLIGVNTLLAVALFRFQRARQGQINRTRYVGKGKMNAFALSTLVWTLCWGLGYGQNGILMVENTDGAIRSMAGCREILVCSGMGNGIEWRRFGQRVELGNSTNRQVTRTMSGDRLWRSDVIFDPVQTTDRGVYTCSILGSQPSVTLTVILFVDAATVQISPKIPNVNISSYEETEITTIACPVMTCAETVTVTFLRGNDEVGEGTVDNTRSMVYNLNLQVTEETAGTYACKVDTTNPTDSIIQEFNITGTPIPLPPTTQPPGSTTSLGSPDTSSESPSATGTGSTAASTTDSSALSMAVTGSFSLLISLLVSAIVQIS